MSLMVNDDQRWSIFMKIMVADAVVEDKGDDGQKCFLVAFLTSRWWQRVMNWWRWWLSFKENEVVVDDDADGIDYASCQWRWLWRWWWCPLRLLNDLDNDDGNADDGDDDDDDDAHLDCSQVNQQADCQTTSTASQLPWLIVLFEDGDDGDYGNERDDPHRWWWRWCWGQIRCVCTACCWHMICLSWSEEGNITCIVAVKAKIYIYPHLVKTIRRCT